MFTFFLYFSFILTAILLLYGLSLLSFVVINGYKKNIIEKKILIYKDSVDILIPCHNEGQEVIDTIYSLQNQDFKGIKNIYLLVHNEDDSSIPFIKREFNITENIVCTLSNQTNLNIVLTGFQGKKEKLNYFLPQLYSPYVAFLDADHIATKSWIYDSLLLLEGSTHDISGVQSKREPKSLNNFFQIWDSAQNHIGNELLNISLKTANQSIFFTGTTAVFKSSIFSYLNFSDSITEDTYLSYDLLLTGKKIIYNKTTGSKESVSPTLGDYVARRRRWSNGHNQSFFKHFRDIIFSSHIYLQQRLIFLFHGVFYLVPILAIVMLNIFQGYIFFQFTSNAKFIVVVGSLLLTFITTYFLGKGYRRFFQDSVLSYLYVFPVSVALSLIVIKVLVLDFFHFIISFPYIDDFFGIIQIIIFLIPLIILLYGSIRIKLFNVKQIFLLIISYPLIIFFDMYAITLGFFDYLFGVRTWRIINRSSRKILSKKQLYGIGFIFVIIFGSYGAMVFPKNNCGELKNNTISKFYKTLFPSSPKWDSSFRKIHNKDFNNITIDFFGNVSGKYSSLDLVLDNVKHNIPVNSEGDYSYPLNVPLGFDSKEVVIQTPDSRCFRNVNFTNTVKEVSKSKIFINNEPFLVKGVVPTFLQSSINLDYESGFSQISSLGANLVRTYHVPGELFVEKLVDKKLLFMPQPKLSNWDDNDFKLKGINGLYRRYIDLHEEFNNNPFSFALNLGNEIEIKDRKKSQQIEDLLVKIKEQNLSSLSMYSTFSPYIKYSGDILAVNMLDTGSVYWDKAIPLLRDFESPFVATELGGFAAFFEEVDPRMRSIRLKRQWEKLLALGGSGAVIFQSHDNWAQPVVSGYNNPFEPEQPDDVRGIWDTKNNEKFIASTVRSMFSDIDIQYLDNEIFTTEKIRLGLKNKRDYVLRNIVLYNNEKPFQELDDLMVGGELDIAISQHDLHSDNNFEIHYETHGGIQQIQQLPVPIVFPEPLPFFTDISRVYTTEHSDTIIVGDIIDSDIEIYLPENWEIKNNYLSHGSKKIIKSNYLYEAENITTKKTEQSSDEYETRFHFSVPVKDGSLLILEGLGSAQAELIIGDTPYFIDTHPYRENVIDLNQYITEDYVGEFILKFRPNNTIYLAKKFSANNKDIVIEFQPPKLFQPEKLILEKNIN